MIELVIRPGNAAKQLFSRELIYSMHKLLRGGLDEQGSEMFKTRNRDKHCLDILNPRGNCSLVFLNAYL